MSDEQRPTHDNESGAFESAQLRDRESLSLIAAPASRNSDCDPVEQLADEFLQRLRRGERPSLTEYAERHPQLAAEIRELFPAIAVMERLGPQPEEVRNSASTTSAATSRIPEQLGEYRILREVGRGGMGVVYEAEQMSLGRHVALKILPAHALMDPQLLKRFQQEARAAARLHHTNIVPVFGVGEQHGIHYYAMQFIQGHGLDDVLSELRRLRGQGPEPGKLAEPAARDRAAQRSASQAIARSLVAGHLEARTEQSIVGHAKPATPQSEVAGEQGVPSDASNANLAAAYDPAVRTQSDLTSQPASDTTYFRTVARIGAQVAEALAHAHAQGVLHRDIKPSNLLLDTQGTVWVTDFGLAKQEGSDLSNSGDIVGTLRYMAPERFSGRSDSRSDIYGLGVTLYEMLTRRPAFDASDRPQLIQQITNEEPPRPGKIDRRIPSDLETIVLKAMDKEQDRRYQHASELAEDLRRFLGYLPIQARPITVLERLGRWCQRNPVLAGMCAALLLVFTGGSAASLWQWERAEANLIEAKRQSSLAAANLTEAQHQRTLAEHNLAEAQQQRSLAETNLSEAERQTGRAEKSYEVARKTVDSLFETFHNDSLAARSVPAAFRKQLLELAMEHHQKLVELSGDDAESQAELARSYLRIASMQASVGAIVQAGDACEKAVHVLVRLLCDHQDDDQSRALLAHVYNVLGLYRLQVNRMGQSREALESALKLWTELLETHPDAPNYLNGLTEFYLNFGYLLSRLGELAESIGYHERALAISDRLVEMHPENQAFQRMLSSSLSNLANRKADAGSVDEAVGLRERCLRLLAERLSADPDSAELQAQLASGYNRLGDHYRNFIRLPDRYDRAMNAYRQALETQERLVRENPGIMPFKGELANTYYNMAQVHHARAEHAKALARINQGFEVLKEFERQEPESVERETLAVTLHLKGIVLDAMDRPEAIDVFLRGVQEVRRAAEQAPETPAPKRMLRNWLGELSRMYRKAARFSEAADAALERRTLVAGQPAQLFAVAQDLAATASAITDDKVSQTPEMATNRRRIADDSLDVLREAIAAGWKDFARLRRDTQQGKSPFTAVWEQAGYDELPPQFAFAFGVRAARHISNRDYAGAIRDYSRFVEQEPDNVGMHDRLAHLCVAGPPELRNPEKALRSAAKVIDATPENASRHASLGAAYYRAGRYPESLASLDRARELNKNRPTAFELLFRSMCLHQLGETDQARQALQQAIRLLDGPSPPKAMFPEEFPILRHEAEELLKPADRER